FRPSLCRRARRHAADTNATPARCVVGSLFWSRSCSILTPFPSGHNPAAWTCPQVHRIMSISQMIEVGNAMTKPYARRFIDPDHLYHRWIDPRVYALRHAEVVAYLRSRGWTQVPPDRKGYLVFQEPPGSEVPGGPYYQFVPDSEGVDLPLRMFELV